jgi:hypothetical protein
MNAIVVEIEGAYREESRGLAPVGAADTIIFYLQRGDFASAKYVAKIDRDKFYCQKRILAVLEKSFGCMLHGIVGCQQCRRF